MVELVDTQDLKSCSRKRSAGSIPALSTSTEMQVCNSLTINNLHLLFSVTLITHSDSLAFIEIVIF